MTTRVEDCPSSSLRVSMGARERCEQEAGVASGSGWNLWVWLLGVVVRRYIGFLILLIPIYSSCICSYLQQHPYFFVHFKKCFFLESIDSMIISITMQ